MKILRSTAGTSRISFLCVMIAVNHLSLVLVKATPIDNFWEVINSINLETDVNIDKIVSEAVENHTNWKTVQQSIETFNENTGHLTSMNAHYEAFKMAAAAHEPFTNFTNDIVRAFLELSDSPFSKTSYWQHYTWKFFQNDTSSDNSKMKNEVLSYIIPEVGETIQMIAFNPESATRQGPLKIITSSSTFDHKAMLVIQEKKQQGSNFDSFEIVKLIELPRK